MRPRPHRLAELLTNDRRTRRGRPHPAAGPHPLPRAMPPTFELISVGPSLLGIAIARLTRRFLHRDPITRQMRTA